MTVHSTALVATDRPGRYGKQLVSHLSRRNGGQWSDTDGSGWIDFGSGRAEVSSTEEGLALSLAADGPDLARLEDVIGRHLVRFGARNELRVAWTRENGEPATVQQNDGP